ncbi:archaea-specific SMC-related protein [Halovivax limisalsi]|uniref:archaea-specific SMC-related protein n=1 Tax=Halovivax limisalsi TaxID=1453760 RepID=UPI001FFDB6C4|nr:archaea-specific SMC-related protein [Halovivax limisalsi]
MSEFHISVENVGGIDSTEMTFADGVTLISGRNASNKTSLLQALLFALGTDDVPIRTGADSATVELTIDGRTIRRTASRSGAGVSVSGTPLVEDDSTRFARFAGLLEENALRTAVQTNGDFETLLKEPMDIDELERERAAKLERKSELQAQLDDGADLESRLSTVESTLEDRRAEADELSETLDSLYDELPEGDDELESVREERTNLVSRRERLTAQIGDIEDAIDRLDEKLEELTDERSTLEDEAASTDLESLRAQRRELRDQVADVDERIDVLQSVLTTNREMLDFDVRSVVEYESGIDEDAVECWTCGQMAPISAFEETVEELTSLIEAEKAKRREFDPELDELSEAIEERERTSQRLSRLDERIESAKAKRESHRESIADKREEVSSIEAELESIDEDLERAKDERVDDHAEISERIEETRIDLEAKRREITRLEDERADLEDEIERRDRLESELETVTAEARELGDRIENLESDLRDRFKDAMDELIDALGFDDIDRMWLDGNFDLVIAREIDGAVREDSIENLAESERSMIGLVLGLAGYIAYDVDEIAPVLVLDSLGAFDAERTGKLVDYFGEYTDYLVAAVHPEQTDHESIDQRTATAPGQP